MKYTKRNIIETTVLVLIFAIIVIIFLFSYSYSRERANDARRIADLRKIQNALTLYRHDSGSYPKELIIGEPLSYNDKNYLDAVPLPPKASRNCLDLTSFNYSLKNNDAGNTIYNIEYCLGEETAGIPAGLNLATPAGLSIK